MISLRSLATVGAVAAVVLTGCEGDDVDDSADASAALEAQRGEVRGLVATLAAGAAEALGGRMSSASGRWEGCESVFPEGHRNFRYRASARIEATAATPRPYLDALESVLGDAGLTGAVPGERPAGRTLSAAAGEVEVAFSELPGQGDYVLLDASGPCIDVPKDDREQWEGRPDPAPILD